MANMEREIINIALIRMFHSKQKKNAFSLLLYFVDSRLCAVSLNLSPAPFFSLSPLCSARQQFDFPFSAPYNAILIIRMFRRKFCCFTCAICVCDAESAFEIEFRVK